MQGTSPETTRQLHVRFSTKYRIHSEHRWQVAILDLSRLSLFTFFCLPLRKGYFFSQLLLARNRTDDKLIARITALERKLRTQEVEMRRWMSSIEPAHRNGVSHRVVDPFDVFACDYEGFFLGQNVQSCESLACFESRAPGPHCAEDARLYMDAERFAIISVRSPFVCGTTAEHEMVAEHGNPV